MLLLDTEGLGDVEKVIMATRTPPINAYLYTWQKGLIGRIPPHNVPLPNPCTSSTKLDIITSSKQVISDFSWWITDTFFSEHDTHAKLNKHFSDQFQMHFLTVLGQRMSGPIQLQRIFSYSFLANAAGSVLLTHLANHVDSASYPRVFSSNSPRVIRELSASCM